MAEDKEKNKPVAGVKPLEETIFLLAGLLIVGALMARAAFFLTRLEDIGVSPWWRSLVDFLIRFWPTWKIIALILVAALIIWALYSYLKLQALSSEEEKIYGAIPDDAFSDTEAPRELENERWVQIQKHANSDNPADWRLAIIEADVMLEETLRALRYQGEGVGEMLKSVDANDLTTLDAAWEAHKVRNRIAHAGSDFELTEREIKRVISLFESVFRELQVI